MSFQLETELMPFFADSIRARAITVSNHLIDSISSTRSNATLTLTQRNDIVTNLQDSISLLNDVRDYYSSINKFTGTPKWGASFFPVTKSSEARFFYQGANPDNKIDLLSNFVLQSNLDKTAISSDLISGALSIFQAILSTTVTDNNDTTNHDKVNNKLLYGALLNGKISLPLFYRANKHIAIYIPFNIKGSIDNVAVNRDTATKNTFHFGEFGPSLYIRVPFKYTTYQNNVSFFVNGKMAYIDGGSVFYDKLEKFRHGFWLSQATFGIEVNNKFRIALNVPVYSSEKSITENQSTTIGIQIDPKLLSSK